MKGLFIGLITVDLIYLSDTYPASNQKLVADDYLIAAGGPATNAAVAFSSLGDRSYLLGVLGNHPLSNLIRSDLHARGNVEIIDLKTDTINSPPVSSIIATATTGERAVISINATKSQADIARIPPQILEDIDIISIDGHQMAVSQAIALQAKAHNIPVAIDGGSWKPGFEKVLPYVDYALCSANFYPPGCHNQQDVEEYLLAANIPHIAITHGAEPITYLSQGKRGNLSVPAIKPVDTLGAGDIFHGAFYHYILQEDFTTALTKAAQIASFSCQFFGTREWIFELENFL